MDSEGTVSVVSPPRYLANALIESELQLDVEKITELFGGGATTEGSYPPVCDRKDMPPTRHMRPGRRLLTRWSIMDQGKRRQEREVN